MNKSILPMALAASLAMGAAVTAQAATETFKATLDAKTEVPPHQVPGTGTVTATLDTTARTLTWDVTFSNLTGPATMGHFHGPAAPGANAGVALPWTGAVTSPLHGTATLTPAQVKDLEAGKWYANIHTAANPKGEIRGQLEKATP